MWLALYFGCTPDPVDSVDTSPEEETEIPEAATCDVTEIRADGEDPPHVGDQWTIFLWCDDKLLVGAYKTQLTPPEAGSVDDSTGALVLTWNQAGEAELFVQSGSFKTTRMVTVLPAE